MIPQSVDKPADRPTLGEDATPAIVRGREPGEDDIDAGRPRVLIRTPSALTSIADELE